MSKIGETGWCRLTVPKARLLGMSDASATSTMNLFETVARFVTRCTLDKSTRANADEAPKRAKEIATFMAEKMGRMKNGEERVA
jgi:hypothetical protein